MKNRWYLSSFVLVNCILSSCISRKNPPNLDRSSKLATLAIGALDETKDLAAGSNSAYARLDLKIEGMAPSSYSRTLSFNKSNSSGGTVNDPSIQLNYGSYKFLLSYFNDSGTLLYQSCSGGKAKDGSAIVDETSRIHTIDKPRYEPSISICSLDGEKSTQIIAPKPPESADVEIKPLVVPNNSATRVFPASAKFYVDPYSSAASAAADMKRANNPDARYLEYIAGQGAANWLGKWSGQVGNTVQQIVDRAEKDGSYPVLVAYNIPNRDCGSHSAGGLSPNDYLPWIKDLANGIGERKAIVILEPDAIPGILINTCLSQQEQAQRMELLKGAIQILKAKPKTKVYVDIGHPAWLKLDDAVRMLKQVGVSMADGFSLNVSNYRSTESNIAYGKEIRAQIGNKNFIIDTSRNGIDPKEDSAWCNPPNRALGKAPTFDTGVDGLDAFVWGKRPGESDGPCNGGPEAGAWWNERAIDLAKRANLGF